MGAGLRSIWFFAAFLFAAPACAAPLSACDFIAQSEVEDLLGVSVAPPNVTDMDMCIGWCESVNSSRCDFVEPNAPGKTRKEFYLQISLPPFDEPEKDLPGSVRQAWTLGSTHGREFVEDVPGLGSAAIYYYRADIGQSLFEVYGNQHMVLLVQQMGVFDQRRAITTAVRAATLVLKHYEELPPSRLKGAFQFKPFPESYPWHK